MAETSFGSSWTLKDNKILPDDELKRLFSASRKHGEKIHLQCVLCFNACMRVSEMLHLKARDFNWMTRKITIFPLKKSGWKRVKQPDGSYKSVLRPIAKTVDYPVPKIAMDLARAYIRKRGLSGDQWLFPGATAICPIKRPPCLGNHESRRNVQKAFDAVAVAAGVKLPGRGVHSLKHTRLTETARKTKDPWLVKEVGRHSTVSMSDHYVKYVDFQDKMDELGGRV